MKKIVVVCAIGIFAKLHMAATQFNYDFQRRFGPDSVIYNEPLYFASKEPKNRDKRPKRRSFRDQIRERMHKNDAKKTRKPPVASSKAAPSAP